MMQSLVIPFLTVCLAELGDKSQLSILILASKIKHHFQLLIGVLLAFLVVDGSAILFGSWVTSVIPNNIVKITSGVIFIIFGILALRSEKEDKEEVKLSSKSVFISGFTVIFFAEWGDKTQIASALFAAKYNPVLIFVAVMSAMTLLSLIAIYIGKFFLKKIDKKVISKISGILFILVGLSTFLINK